ncbi:MAG: hypothetical protein JRD68_00940 [Deltaproteobacteria bacterium]|nr:hypothetical protein [Deltaproteobacteria bacterium]
MSEVKPGIYLEIKKTTIGSGSTSRDASFRNFWLAVFQEDGKALITLLDDDFKLTGLNEMVTSEQLASDRFTYIPEGEKRYEDLLEVLKKRAAAIKKAAALKEEKKKQTPVNKETPQSGPANSALGFLGMGNKEKAIKPGDLFQKNPSQKDSD